MCSSLAPHLDMFIPNMDSHCSLVPSAPAIHNGVLLTSRRQCTCIHLLVDQVIPGIPGKWMRKLPGTSMIWRSAHENGKPQLVSGAYLSGAPWKNSLMKLEPDMGRREILLLQKPKQGCQWTNKRWSLQYII